MNVKNSNLLFGSQEVMIGCRNSQGAAIRATPVRLTRFSTVFEVYNPHSLLQLSEVLSEFRIVIGDRCVYAGRAVVSNLVNTGIMLLCEATLDEDWLEVDLFSPITQPERLLEELETCMAGWRKTLSIGPQFKVAVADFQMLLMDLRRWLDQVELGVRSEPTGRRSDLERRVLLELERRILPEISEWMDQFDAVADQVDDELRPACRAYTRRQIHPLVMCSPFVYRTFQKPLGYAGDYEMVNMILRDPHEGATLFAKLVNVVFLQNPPAEAHRNRVRHLQHRLSEETGRVATAGRTARILNLGCGPAREVEAFIAEDELSNAAEFWLLDFNAETLAHTRQRLEGARSRHGRRTALHFEERSINQLLKEALRPGESQRSGCYDFVYCAGLFDYVSDRVCQRLTDLFCELLAPGGLMLATNVAAAKPFRQSMDYLLEWHLIYRDREQMEWLVPTHGPPLSWQVAADPTGVNLFLEVRKPGGPPSP